MSEIWPLVFEKAYSQYMGGQIAGCIPQTALELLTGRPAPSASVGEWTGYTAEELERDVAAGKPVIVSTKDEGQTETVVPHHAYVVTGTERRDGRLYVQMHNPWNDCTPPPPIEYGHLRRSILAVDVGSVQ